MFLFFEKIRKKLSKKLLGWIFTLFYAPRKVSVDYETDGVKVTEVLREASSPNYKVYDIPEGKLFTDRIKYIAISRRKSLIPGASWQWEDGLILPPSKNPVLSKGTPQLITHYKGSLLSLLTGGGGNYNYYHWLYDVLPRIGLCESLINLNDIDYLLVPDLCHQFQWETLNILNISKNKLISSANVQHISADNLLVTDHPNPDPSNLPKWIVDWLRLQFLSEARLNLKFNSLIYIERSDSVNNRRLLNEKEVVAFLKEKGFSTYRLSELSVREQISLFYHAEIIVGVHGAGFANLAFCKPGTKVIEFFGKGYTPKMYERISMCNSLNYIPLISNDVELNESPQKANFFVSIEALKQNFHPII